MRALVCRELGSHDNLSLERVDDPIPAAGEVLVDVAAAGINFPDLLIVEGKYQHRPQLPFVPGGECAGVVAATGDGVERWEVGQRVIGLGLTGSFAERIVLPETALMPVPEGLDLGIAAGTSITYGTAYHALKQRARLAVGESLLVLGAAGGVGLAAVELGKHLGARVLAAAGTADKLAVAGEAGADEGILYDEESLKDRVKELTGGRGADVVFDPVGGGYTEQALRATAWDGRLLVVGFAAGEIPRVPLNLTLLKGCQIVGVFWGSWAERRPAESAKNFAELHGRFLRGELSPWVERLPLEGWREALDRLAGRRAVGKLVLTMGSDG